MPIKTLGELFSHPGFICLFIAILIVVINIIVGVSISPKDKRKKGYGVHRFLYYASIIFFAAYLIVSHYLQGNGVYEYFVMVYFLLAVPWSRKINVTLHAIITSTGLVFFLGLFVFTIL